MALDDILRRQPVWRGARLRSEIPVVSTGHRALDEALPGGGWPRGALTEVLAGAEGIGELALVLPALGALSWSGKRVVWLAPPHLPYAPALAAAGVDLSQLVVVHVPGRRDALCAAGQVLRSGCCHALLAWCSRVRYEELRRLALAAEAGPAWVTVFRPREAAAESSPACLRLAIDAAGDSLSVRILKRRGPPLAEALSVPVNRPVHALGRTRFPQPAAGLARAARRLGLPVHA